MKGTNYYEIEDEDKRKFDKTFPFVKGQYPKIAITVTPFDLDQQYSMYKGMFGVTVKRELEFKRVPAWKYKGEMFWVDCIGSNTISSGAQNIHWQHDSLYNYINNDIKTFFDTCDQCPQDLHAFGKAGDNLAEQYGIMALWKSYISHTQQNKLDININKELQIDRFNCSGNGFSAHIIYNGIYLGSCIKHGDLSDNDVSAVFFTNGYALPDLNTARTEIKNTPIEISMALYAMLKENEENADKGIAPVTFRKWKELLHSDSGSWFEFQFSEHINRLKDSLQHGNGSFTNSILDNYCISYLLDKYDLIASVGSTALITFERKTCDNSASTCFEMFPPALFCKAASEDDRQYIRSKAIGSFTGDYYCLILDHPYINWLLKNAEKLFNNYTRQFEQIIDALLIRSDTQCISTLNSIREQLLRIAYIHGIDISNCPNLSKNDFWNN